MDPLAGPGAASSEPESDAEPESADSDLPESPLRAVATARRQVISKANPKRQRDVGADIPSDFTAIVPHSLHGLGKSTSSYFFTWAHLSASG
jgi:hypothetical protein